MKLSVSSSGNIKDDDGENYYYLSHPIEERNIFLSFSPFPPLLGPMSTD